jgi:exonuclease SbcD
MSFKVLHTADWHLGQTFRNVLRHEEHALFLDWLVQIIAQEKIDCLVVAGDIFDVSTPSNQSIDLYFRFLSRLRQTQCRHTIIVGGNHDSPTFLNSPSAYLKYDAIHVVGEVANHIQNQIITLYTPQGLPEAIVVAVPFLRDRDIRTNIAGQTDEERTESIRQGIIAHYTRLAEMVQTLDYHTTVPIIATGHLYAAGAKRTCDERTRPGIVGNLESIAAEQFPTIFDYIALGHLHQQQIVGNLAHIRYAGSPIPLSFVETDYVHSVTLVCFDKDSPTQYHTIPVPRTRKLYRLEGDVETLEAQLLALEHHTELGSLVEITLRNAPLGQSALEHLRAICTHLPIQMWLNVKSSSLMTQLAGEQVENLEELTPQEVFDRLLETKSNLANATELRTAFNELMDWMKDSED